MDKDSLKNIVVLKNLPSNIVDEAIIILKPNKKIKKPEIVDKKINNANCDKEAQNNKHVINEAEMLVNNYISKLEKSDNKINVNNNFKEKYNRLKKYAFVSSIILMMSIILHFV